MKPEPMRPSGHEPEPCRWCKGKRIEVAIVSASHAPLEHVVAFCPHCDARCLRDPARCPRCASVVRAGG